MRKILFILLVLLSVNGYSIDPFNMIVNIELGVMPRGHLKQYETYDDVYPNVSFYGDTYFEFQFIDNIIFTGIETKIFIWKTDEGYDFSPDYIHFMFTAGLRYKVIEAGWRHTCIHPIISWIDDYYESSNWELWYDEVYLKFNFSLF